MARLLVFILLVFFGVRVPDLHAALTSARARTLTRFKRQCDDGSGKACYDYGRALWSTPGAIDRKTAKKYLLRGCELHYKLACDAANDHSTITRYTHRNVSGQPQLEGTMSGVCFSHHDLTKAHFTANEIARGVVRGQQINKIEEGSFWARVGLSDGDVIVQINNQPVNTAEEISKIFANTGKKYGFDVEHGGLSIVLWYTCL